MSNKPTIVLVAGSWHRAETWDKVDSFLEKEGHKCIPIGLQSSSSNASASILDDITAVRDAIVAETTQGRDVVVVVHSFGGVVGESAIKGLTRPRKGSASVGKSGHVIGLVMIATGFILTGMAFLDGSAGKPPPFWEITSDGFAKLLGDEEDLRDLFYHDLPVEEGKEWVSKLTQQSVKALAEGREHTYAGWMDVPVWFLATTADHAFAKTMPSMSPLDIQTFFVKTAKDAGADVTMREIDASHSPMLSKPKETAEVILEAVAAFVS